MKQLVVPLALSLTLGACAWFQSNPDSGQPVIDSTTNRSVRDVISCLTVEATRHGSSFNTTSLPQGEMLDFGDSNVIKVRADNGTTTYRFYAGKRHAKNFWIEGASKTCAP
ncbi:hypothetical protein [Paraburkholderia tropica]|uniref:Lipoprotein n=1 Tax=Paraburkholderia tropica TaxID=92647 RepID=A0AAQ1GBM9_9BURK|nr:hypothetical protein [Paraburkholderia tropica]RQN33813.1 hypothetical protein EHZ25_37780 [Paraburkholderia tropica]SEI92154.1 hypothetical protein SAMN05216550_101410 [Paraburkholderia tropica]